MNNPTPNAGLVSGPATTSLWKRFTSGVGKIASAIFLRLKGLTPIIRRLYNWRVIIVVVLSALFFLGLLGRQELGEVFFLVAGSFGGIVVLAFTALLFWWSMKHAPTFPRLKIKIQWVALLILSITAIVLAMVFKDSLLMQWQAMEVWVNFSTLILAIINVALVLWVLWSTAEDGPTKLNILKVVSILVLLALLDYIVVDAQWVQPSSPQTEEVAECESCGLTESVRQIYARPDRADVGELRPITLQPGETSYPIRDYNGKPLNWDEAEEGPTFEVHSRKRGEDWKPFLQSGVYEVRFALPDNAYGPVTIVLERRRM